MIDFISTREKTELLELIDKVIVKSNLAPFKVIVAPDSSINVNDLDDVSKSLIKDFSRAYRNKSLTPLKVRETALSFNENHKERVYDILLCHLSVCKGDTSKFSDLATVVFYELCRAQLGEDIVRIFDLDYEYEERKKPEAKPEVKPEVKPEENPIERAIIKASREDSVRCLKKILKQKENMNELQMYISEAQDKLFLAKQTAEILSHDHIYVHDRPLYEDVFKKIAEQMRLLDEIEMKLLNNLQEVNGNINEICDKLTMP